MTPNRRRLAIAAAVLVGLGAGALWWTHRSSSSSASVPNRSAEVRVRSSSVRLPIEGEPQRREREAKALDEAEAEGAKVPDEYPDAVEAGIVEDANEQLLDAVRPCVQRASKAPPLYWSARFRYDVVVERDHGRLENVETIDAEMADAALFACVKTAVTSFKFASRGDVRISAEMTIPIGTLGGAR